MLSNKKLKGYLREWLKNSLTDAADRGMSLKDDTDGISLYIDSVEEPTDGTILLGLSIVKGDDLPRREELALIILRKTSSRPEKPKADKAEPIAADLLAIDGETS